MQGDVVKAARWLGGSIVAASLVLVVGFHPGVTSRVVTVTRVQPTAEYLPQPFVNTIGATVGRCDVGPVVQTTGLIDVPDAAPAFPADSR